MTGMTHHPRAPPDATHHLRHSVHHIPTPPIGYRAMRREYGSLLPGLIDAPLNDPTLLQAYATSIMALIRWEPRIRVTAIRRRVRTTQPGGAVLEIDGQTRTGQPLQLEVPIA